MHVLQPHLNHVDAQAVKEVRLHLRRPLALGEIDCAGAVAHVAVLVDAVAVQYLRVHVVVGYLLASDQGYNCVCVRASE